MQLLEEVSQAPMEAQVTGLIISGVISLFFTVFMLAIAFRSARALKKTQQAQERSASALERCARALEGMVPKNEERREPP